MSKFRLRSYDLTPPGGYPYTQAGDKPKQFKSQPMIEAQAQIVSNYRKGNGLARSSVREAIEDIDCQTCARLGNMPQFCVPQDSASAPVIAMAANSPIIAPPCQGCGAPVQ